MKRPIVASLAHLAHVATHGSIQMEFILQFMRVILRRPVRVFPDQLGRHRLSTKTRTRHRSTTSRLRGQDNQGRTDQRQTCQTAAIMLSQLQTFFASWRGSSLYTSALGFRRAPNLVGNMLKILYFRSVLIRSRSSYTKCQILGKFSRKASQLGALHRFRQKLETESLDDV